MGTFNTATRNAMLDGVTIDKASLHTADPGETGANELAGGTYARQSITVGAAAAGVRDATALPTFSVPAGATVQYVGYWTAGSPDIFVGSDQVTAEAFAADGQYALSSASFNAT